MLYDGESCCFSKSYHLHIVDRVGGGTDAPMPEAKDEQKNTQTSDEDEKFEPVKSKYRKAGTGCITKLNDHLWEGRYTPTVNGKRMARNVYAHTEEECEEKLAQMIREMKIEIEKLKQGG